MSNKSRIWYSNITCHVTSRCIHLNPLRANMVEKPEDYEWRSYNMFIDY